MHRSPGLRFLSASAACVTLGAAAYLAAHHPLWPALALAALALWVAVNLHSPGLWLFAVPAALPLANLSPWTGWIAFEEFDLLVLGAIAAGHARLAWTAPPHPPAGGHRWAMGLSLAALALVGLYRGVSDAGGWSFGWFDGYVEPLNSVRVAKPLVYVLLAWPLARDRLLAAGDDAVFRRLGSGMLAGLVVVGLAVMWERGAYPGLLNFSAPYRTTALFWEMHVGGAAIDGYLAMAAPFVAWAVWTARTPAHWAGAAALALLAGYACLTTFSRGVYGAVALPLALLGWWLWAHRPDASPPRARRVAAIGAAAAGVLFLVFGRQGFAGVGLMLLGLGVGLAALQRTGWVTWRIAAGLMLAMGLVIETLAVLGPDSFMRARLAAADMDSGSRLAHWRAGVGLLEGPAEGLVGVGLGRLPARYAGAVPDGEFSGATRLIQRPEGGHAALVLGPRTSKRLAGQYGLTQRVPLAPRYRAAFDVRADTMSHLYLHVCERHLLYDGACQAAFVRIPPGDGSWRRLEVPLRGPALRRGAWYASRRAAFTLSIANAAGAAAFDNVVLYAPDGEQLLRNAGFSNGLAHWLPGAQAYYVPWHIDNLYLEALIERGAAGLVLLAGAVALSVRRVFRAARHGHRSAPYLAASLAGALCIGLVSSLLDVPRIAFLLGLLAVFAFELSEPRSGRS